MGLLGYNPVLSPGAPVSRIRGEEKFRGQSPMGATSAPRYDAGTDDKASSDAGTRDPL